MDDMQGLPPPGGATPDAAAGIAAFVAKMRGAGKGAMNAMVPDAGAATAGMGMKAGDMGDEAAALPVSSGLPPPEPVDKSHRTLDSGFRPGPARASPFAGVTDAALHAAVKVKGPSSAEAKELLRRVNEPVR